MAQSILSRSVIALFLCSQVRGSHDFKKLSTHVRDLKSQALANTAKLSQLLGSVDTTSLDTAIAAAETTLESMSLSDDCLTNATAALTALRESTIEEWGNCTAVTAVEKLGLMAYDTADFAAGLLVILDEYINGFYNCLSYNPFTLVPCMVTYAFAAVKNVWTTVSLVQTYISDVESNVDEVNDIITQACLDLPTAAIQAILTDAESCT